MSLVVIVGRSGSGKSSVSDLMQKCLGYSKVITYTTRPPRAGERDGIEYHFVSPEEFLERLSYGEFVEHTQFAGNYYGTLRSDIEQPKRRFVIVLDQQGAVSMKNAFGKKAFVVGIEVDSETSRASMKARSDSEESIERRVGSEALLYKNLCWVCDYVVKNNGHTKSVAQVTAEVHDSAEEFFSSVS